MEATAAMVSVAMGVGFVPLPTFFIDLKIFKWKCPLENAIGLPSQIYSRPVCESMDYKLPVLNSVSTLGIPKMYLYTLVYRGLRLNLASSRAV